jgi:hypothetical protein
MFKVQLILLTGSVFVDLPGEEKLSSAEKAAEDLYKDNIKNKVRIAYVALWEGDKVVDTFDGQTWGREHVF